MSITPHIIKPQEVHSTLAKYILADGFDMVLDLKKSQGLNLVDARTGESYVDFFSFFASQALGMNHPKLNAPEFIEKIGKVALNKPSNSDVYTEEMAEFVDLFGRFAKPDHFKYLFFVEGGSVANENGIKVAFDWKIRKNYQKGYKTERGHQVLHFRESFHGRTGYTLSLTNTDPTKTMHFPKFDWPRVTNPKITFPLEDHLNEVLALEKMAIDEIYTAINANKDDIAVIIIEPIQGEGGDNMFRKEFLQKLRDICDEHDILLMFDEVQTGFGMTGKMWASEYYVMPDILSFGKKTQVCGIMASARLDEVEDHCFKISSRINSTWGGNFTDMVRCTKIMEVMIEDNLVENASIQGEYLLGQLNQLQTEFPKLLTNARGLGLWASIDLPTPQIRSQFLNEAYSRRLAILGCGVKSIRFRTPLIVDQPMLDKGLNIIRDVLTLLNK